MPLNLSLGLHLGSGGGVGESAPLAPTAMPATNVTDTTLSANWLASTGATSYRLDVSTVSNFATFVSGFEDLEVTGAVTKAVTGLTQGTTYYYRVRAVNGGGTSESSSTITIATIPTSAPEMTLTKPQGCSFVWAGQPTSGNLNTLIDGGYITIPDATNVTATFEGGAWTIAATSYPRTLTILKFPTLRLLTLVNPTWSYSGHLPNNLTSIFLNGNNVNWTNLNIGDAGNLTTLLLSNYRTNKMSSADMLILLYQLTYRTGTLPATITINDYADYASPPAEVTTAVNLLKATKTVTTVNLGA